MHVIQCLDILYMFSVHSLSHSVLFLRQWEGQIPNFLIYNPNDLIFYMVLCWWHVSAKMLCFFMSLSCCYGNQTKNGHFGYDPE